MIVHHGSPTPGHIRQEAEKRRDAYVIKLLMRLNRATNNLEEVPPGTWLEGLRVLSRKFSISMQEMLRLHNVAYHEQDSDSE